MLLQNIPGFIAKPKVEWVAAGFICLATLSSWSTSQAAQVTPLPITASTIIVVPNHATYDVSNTTFIQGQDGLLHARAPFGSGGGCPLQSTINSFWPSSSDSQMTLRKQFDLAAGVTGVRVLLSIDNDAVVVFNGTTVRSIVHEGCPTVDEIEVRIPDSLLIAGLNTLELQVRDRGVESYVDLRVLAELP